MVADLRIEIAPSILSADFSRLGEQVVEAAQGGADRIHVDVMDGHFVPNLTLGPLVVAAIRPWTDLTLEAHLMIAKPERFVAQFADAGADIVIVHAEACTHLHRMVQQIKEAGAKVGVALNPATPVSSVEEILSDLDQVLVMTVEPGFGGQAFIETMVDKVHRVRQMLDRQGLSADLEVDGGINAQTAKGVVEAGARVLVAGSAVFDSGTSVAEAISRIKKSIEAE